MKNLLSLNLRIFLLLSIALVSMSCHQESVTPLALSSDGKDTMIFYKKSACFGFCPVYEILVRKNGEVQFEGILNVDYIGVRYAQLNAEKGQLIMERANRINFFKLANVYPIEKRYFIADLPNTLIILKNQGSRKEININHSEPEELRAYLNDMDGILRSLFLTLRS